MTLAVKRKVRHHKNLWNLLGSILGEPYSEMIISPVKFGGRTVLPRRRNLHDGIEYAHKARFDSDEQIDNFLNSNPCIIKSARDIVDGILTLWFS